jgi:hypothetical protein
MYKPENIFAGFKKECNKSKKKVKKRSLNTGFKKECNKSKKKVKK